MSASPVSGLVIAPPSRWRDGLCVLLKTSCPAPALQLAADVNRTMLELTNHLPSWVVVDADLLDQRMHIILQDLIERQPAVRCLIIIHTARQAQQSLALAGAQTLADGFTLTDLLVALQRPVAADSFTV